jgi:SAM-dependent methyltransferase
MAKPVERERDVDAAARYFASFAGDYHRAFDGGGRNPLHRFLNRMFRRKTFQLRTEVVERILAKHGLAGKAVLDLGCGSGEISLIAARLGASSVTGFDIVPEMVELAREQASRSPWRDKFRFSVEDITRVELPPADVVLVVAVIEYYRDIEDIVTRVAHQTRELLIIVDTRGPLWRRLLRYGLAWFKNFHVYYHPIPDVIKAVEASGLTSSETVLGHSFTVFSFTRTPSRR